MQGWGSGFRIRFPDPVSGSGALGVPTCGRYSKCPWISFLDNLQVLFFIFYFLCQTFHWCSRSKKPTRNRGFTAYRERLTPKVSKQKRWLAKLSRIFIHLYILNIFYRSGYRVLDPKFCQNRILIPGKMYMIIIYYVLYIVMFSVWLLIFVFFLVCLGMIFKLKRINFFFFQKYIIYI